MSLASWIRQAVFGGKPNPHYVQARKAIADLNNSAIGLNKELRDLPYSPFRAIVVDLERQRAVSEYDQRQAAKIYEEKIPK